MNWSRWALFLSITALVAGCGGTPSPPVIVEAAPPASIEPSQTQEAASAPRAIPDFGPLPEEEINIAVLLPLSGPARDAGNALFNAITLAYFDAADPRLQLYIFDTRGTQIGAGLAIDGALSVSPDVILGPLFGSSVEVVAEKARRTGVPVIGFSNDRRAAGPGAYLLSFLPENDVEHILDFAARKGKSRIAALLPATDYGDRVNESMESELASLGLSLAGLEVYTPSSANLFEPVRRLANYNSRKAAYDAEIAVLEELGDDLSLEVLKTLEPYETLGELDYDTILVPQGGALLRSLAPLLPFYEIDPAKIQYLGTSLWDDPSLANEPPLAGAWFAAPDPGPIRQFETRYQSLFDIAPPRIATLGYDAMSLLALLALNPMPENRFSDRQITSEDGFVGLDGPFRFLPSGLLERNLAIMEIQPSGVIVLEAAAQGFRFVDRIGRLDSSR